MTSADNRHYVKLGLSASEECRAGAHELCDIGRWVHTDPDCLQCTCEHHAEDMAEPAPHLYTAKPRRHINEASGRGRNERHG